MSYLLSPVHEILAIFYGLIAILRIFFGYKLVVLNFRSNWQRDELVEAFQLQ
jgi:hypothetical protein